jgi:hypothetical protein
MTAPQTPPPNAYSPIPPPPPPTGSRRGCLRVGLIGCGVLAVLAIIGIAVSAVWWNRNRDDITASAGAAAREGARFGLVRDEAACIQEAQRRAATGATLSDDFAVGAFARSCLEYSRPTPGFCENVPPVTSIRRSVEWQQQRCGTDAACRDVSQVVQQYCAADRTKRPATDTLLMGADGAPPPAGTPPPGAAAEPDSGTF